MLDQLIIVVSGKSRHNPADTFNVVYPVTDGVTVKIPKKPTTTLCWWWRRWRQRTATTVILDHAPEKRVKGSRYYSAKPAFTRLIVLRRIRRRSPAIHFLLLNYYFMTVALACFPTVPTPRPITPSPPPSPSLPSPYYPPLSPFFPPLTSPTPPPFFPSPYLPSPYSPPPPYSPYNPPFLPVRPPFPSPPTTTAASTSATTIPPACCPPLVQTLSAAGFQSGSLSFSYNSNICATFVVATCSAPSTARLSTVALVVNQNSFVAAEVAVLTVAASCNPFGQWVVAYPPLVILNLSCVVTDPSKSSDEDAQVVQVLHYDNSTIPFDATNNRSVFPPIGQNETSVDEIPEMFEKEDAVSA